MTSQVNLIARLDALERVANNPAAITTAPDHFDHNASAQILRNGLAVVAFTVLEDFLRTRASELLGSVQSRKAFIELPEKLQHLATVGVLEAVAYRKRYVPIVERQAFVQSHAVHVASTVQTAYTISPLSAFNAEPNIQDETIADFLKGMRIEAPWTQITDFAGRLGLGVLDARQAFKDLSMRRNEAAHDAASKVEHSDLVSSIDAALAIAVSFDILATRAADTICTTPAGAAVAPLNAAAIAFRRIDQSGPSKWRESREHGVRAVRLHTSPRTARAEASARAGRNREALIDFRLPTRPIYWALP